jgi:hypothetical protein
MDTLKCRAISSPTPRIKYAPKTKVEEDDESGDQDEYELLKLHGQVARIMARVMWQSNHDDVEHALRAARIRVGLDQVAVTNRDLFYE